MNITMDHRWLIILHDENNNELIAAFDMDNVKGEVMEYYYYYFEGYENFMSYLLKRGAKRCDDTLLDEKYLSANMKIIPIYEVDKRRNDDDG